MSSAAAPRTPAPAHPVARVLPLLGLPQLDRLFDYKVDREQDQSAQPGVRVKIPFAGRTVDGVIRQRVDQPEFPGQISWLAKVVSPVQVVPPQLFRLIDALAIRYAGTRSDILRSAVPTRVADAESTDRSVSWEKLGAAQEPDLSAWSAYHHGQSFVDALLSGESPRAAWQIAPGDNWAEALASLAVKTALEGKGALIVVPDQRDVDTLRAAVLQMVSARQVTCLTATMGRRARYSAYLAILAGQARIVIGTRSAAFAPVHNLALVVVYSDGDDNLVDRRAPYTHVREIFTTRAAQEHCALLIAGHNRTAETQMLVESGWMHDLVADRATIHARMAWIHTVTDFDLQRHGLGDLQRVPSIAFDALRKALEQDKPALIQVPRTGYAPALACGQCRTPARCRACNGPLEIPSLPGGQGGLPTCRWCGRPEPHFHCQNCGSQSLRSTVVGAHRTLEEFGRAFPSVPVTRSSDKDIVSTVPAGKRLVVSTPGAEPQVVDTTTRKQHLYGAAVLLDSWILLGRQDLRVTERTLATWAQAATLVEPRREGGEIVVVADPGLAPVQYLLRWDMVGAARSELEGRRQVGFPPAVRMAAIDGPATAIELFRSLVELPEGAEVLGPVPLPPGVTLPGEYDVRQYGGVQRILIRCPAQLWRPLGSALKSALAAKLVRKNTLPLRVVVDPVSIG